MASTFGQRIDMLLDRVGQGDLTANVSCDQVYSAFQHNSLDLRHPRGGGPLFLTQPLMDHYERYLQRYAAEVLGEDGGHQAFIDAAEDLAGDGGIATHAPIELGDLRASGHPVVTSDGDTIYDRAPLVHRLSPEELKAKDKAREAMPGAWIPYWWYHGERTKSGLNVIHRGGA